MTTTFKGVRQPIASKPISNATQNALHNKQTTISIHSPSGGQPLMNGASLKGLVASSPITLTSNTDNLTLGLNPTGLTLATVHSRLATTTNILNMAGGLLVSGASAFNNNVIVAPNKTLTATTASILGTLAVGGATNLYDNTTIATGKSLNVGGTTTLSDNVTIASGKTLTVGGAATFQDNVFLASGKSINFPGTAWLKSDVHIGQAGNTMLVNGFSSLQNDDTIYK